MKRHGNGNAGPNGEQDPFRDYVLRALDELLKFAERSDQRWAEQERRWEEQERRWEEQERRWEEQERRWEDQAHKMKRLNELIEGTTLRTVAALKQVAESLRAVTSELKSMRRRRGGHGGNGHGNGR